MEIGEPVALGVDRGDVRGDTGDLHRHGLKPLKRPEGLRPVDDGTRQGAGAADCDMHVVQQGAEAHGRLEAEVLRPGPGDLDADRHQKSRASKSRVKSGIRTRGSPAPATSVPIRSEPP